MLRGRREHSSISNHQNCACGSGTALVDAGGVYSVRGGWRLPKIELDPHCVPGTVSDVMVWNEVPDPVWPRLLTPVLFAHRLATHLDAVGVMHQPVENAVGQGGIPDL